MLLFVEIVCFFCYYIDMGYHIDTGLIKEKFATPCECPLCEIQKIVEEQFLHEFLNDAVMEDSARAKVNKLGFCGKHFDMLFARPNKLSVALQITTRTNTLQKLLTNVKSVSQAKKQAKALEKQSTTCIICDLTNESMVKYYKTVAQLFNKEKDFYKTLLSTKGFCLKHYSALLNYASYAGFTANAYVEFLSGIESRNFERLQSELKVFCDKHDYRNAREPLGNAEDSLKRMGEKLYGKKYQ